MSDRGGKSHIKGYKRAFAQMYITGCFPVIILNVIVS